MLKIWKKLTEEIIHVNPWWTYKKDTFRIEGGATGEYHYVDSPGSVMIIPIAPGDKIIMVRQHRYLNGRTSIEFPGGGVKPGAAHAQMAAEELREEAGVEAQHLDCIGEFNPFNGVTNEMCKVYVARGLRPVHAQPDETEEFELCHFSEDEVDALITEGELWDGMSLAAWNLYKLRTPNQHISE